MILFVFISISLPACGINLHSSSLKIGIVNQAYSDTFNAEELGWRWGADTAFLVTSGGLPPGIDLTGRGELVGVPTAVGDFEFEVTAYWFDTGFWDDDFWDDDDDVDEDWEWYTLFVTETNTNPLCPSPDDEAATENYLCLGEVALENLGSGEEVIVDVNWFTDFTNGNGYDIMTLDFSVFYDPATLTPVTDKLNSQILREAATRTIATVAFSAPTAGELRVAISAQSLNLHKSGRLVDLPFTAATALPAGQYPLTIVINDIVSGSGSALPANVEIDGMVEVTAGVSAEEPAAVE